MHQWRRVHEAKGRVRLCVDPLPSSLLLLPLGPFLPLPSVPLEVGPLNPIRGYGEHCKLPQLGLGWSPNRNRIWRILGSKYDIYGGNNFNDFPEIIPTREIKTKIEKTSFSRPRPWAYFWNGPLCCSINSTHLNPAVIFPTAGGVICSGVATCPPNPDQCGSYDLQKSELDQHKTGVTELRYAPSLLPERLR